MSRKPSSADAEERRLEKLVDALTMNERKLLPTVLENYPEIGVKKAVQMRAAGA